MGWEAVLQQGEKVARYADLVDAGLSMSTLRSRVRSGRWQRVLPGVLVAHSGPMSARQRWRAGLAYAGPGAVLSYRSAAHLHGLRIVERDVEVTVPHGCRRPPSGFVVVHQALVPVVCVVRVGLPCTDAARTLVDVACRLPLRGDVRAMVSDAVQRRLVDVDDLRAQVDSAPPNGSRWLRLTLDEVVAGARSAGEAEFLQLIRRARLPEPEWNATVHTASGSYVVDALWRKQRVGGEVDGMAWHLDAASWEQDLRRQNHIHAAGFTLLRFPVRRLRDDPLGVIDDLRAALCVPQPPPHLP
jgi:very-short-patch-repair endonuclease